MVSLLVCGDFVPCHRVSSQIEEGQYNCLEAVKPFLKQADYSIVNFESPVVTRAAKPIDKTGPNLCCTEKALDCLAKIGFSCVTLANNHFRDYGQIGVEDTISACKNKGIDYVGGGTSLNEARQILYKNINGKCLAIINVCENEWSIAGKNHGGSAPLNPIQNYYSIENAKNEADYVIVIIHGGIEGYQFPTPRMTETYRFFVDAGADVVINHHQHCYSGYEVYKGKPIFYGLGNFCFDRKGQMSSIWNEGFMVRILFSNQPISYEIIPYIQCSANPVVRPMDAGEKCVFDKQISVINSIIANPVLLLQQFQRRVDSVYESRLLALEPFNNRIIKMLQIKKLFPRFIRREQKKSLYMRIGCESNSETLIWIFKKYFNI